MMDILPFLLIAVGVAMRAYVGRAAFYRRNEFGAETFNSYAHMKERRGLEGLIRFAGLILILVGIGQALNQGIVHRSNALSSSATKGV